MAALLVYKMEVQIRLLWVRINSRDICEVRE